MWVKWRHKFSSGDGDWDYFETSRREDIEETLEEKEEEFAWDGGEHYRRTEYEIVDYPPKEWISFLIGRLEDDIFFASKRVEELKKLLKE